MCDPNLESCPVEDDGNFLDVVNSASLEWLTVLYGLQAAIIPLLSGLLLWSNASILSSFWGIPLWFFHLFSFVPTAVINMFFIFFGDGNSSAVAYLDDTAILLIAYYTANMGVISLSLGFLITTIYWLFNFFDWGYILLFLLYNGFGFYTEYFQITKGVEIIRTIIPYWPGTRSGMLWPYILWAVGLVDENGKILHFSDSIEQDMDQEVKPQRETSIDPNALPGNDDIGGESRSITSLLTEF